MICPLDVATELMETLPIYDLGGGGLAVLTAKTSGECLDDKTPTHVSPKLPDFVSKQRLRLPYNYELLHHFKSKCKLK
jgi:hypothetical protein